MAFYLGSIMGQVDALGSLSWFCSDCATNAGDLSVELFVDSHFSNTLLHSWKWCKFNSDSSCFLSKGSRLTLLYWQINWFACIGLTITGLPEIAGLAVLPLLVRGVVQCSSVRLLLVPSFIAGVVFEIAFQWIGWTSWTSGVSYGGLPPLFLLGLWVNMALAWKTFLTKAPNWVVYLLFLFGTAPAYIGGASLGCIEVSNTWESYLGIGLAYCIALAFMHSILKMRAEL